MTPGIHLIHKPEGPTSFSVVQSARTAERPRICHGGTLDPFASGLLLLLVEPATRLFDYLHDVPKVYQATVRWGVETDNGDPHGGVIFTGDPSGLRPEQLDEALAACVGWHDQTPHATSAKRVDGERAYVKAHRGETVIMPATKVYMHEASWVSHDLPRESVLKMTVRGGYYVRALARDLGRSLGCGAHLAKLHRAAIGPWIDPGPGRPVEIHGREILPWTPVYILSDQDIGDLRKHKIIPLTGLLPPDWALPDGFPAGEPIVRGFHQGRFCFLLEALHESRQLRVIAPLPGGL